MPKPFNSFGQQAGITPKAQQWVERITKAASAQLVPATNANVQLLPLRNTKASNNFSEVSTLMRKKRQNVPAGLTVIDPNNIFDFGNDPELMAFAREYDFRRSERLEHEKWEKLFKEKLYRAANGRTDIRVNGVEWSTYTHDGIFAYKKFEEEQPEAYEEFSKWETRRVVDKARLEAERPDLFRKYQAATLRRIED